MPNIVVSELGGARTDAGMLGSAIYFANSATYVFGVAVTKSGCFFLYFVFLVFTVVIFLYRTSAKYSRTSKSCGTRFMLLHEVALGNSRLFTSHQKHLTKAPAGYDSCHGVRHTEALKSDFQVCCPYYVRSTSIY